MTERSSANPLKPAEKQPSGARSRIQPPPCAVVVFGITGDLAHRKIIPALYSLAADGLIPDRFALVGVGRRALSEEEIRNSLHSSVGRYARRSIDPRVWSNLASKIFYHHGNFDDPNTYNLLRQRLKQIDSSLGTEGNRVFYLATPPDLFLPTVRQLGRANLIYPRFEPSWSRVVVEKPFGHDLDSARQLNSGLAQILREDQIYRIDHYLGKETVQNILVFRFANSIFEPVWNHTYIDHVQITASETLGMEGRGAFFDRAGILRDMVQNHLLQILSIVAMEPPIALDANAVRDEKLKVLRAIRKFSPAEASANSVRGQYGPGWVEGQKVVGYREEEGVSPTSNTETYAALKLYVDNWRWSGVPFYLRAGKRLPKRVTEVAIQFREVPHLLFPKTMPYVGSNVLVLRIQPDEGISLRITSKIPGSSDSLQPVRMEFRYGTVFGADPPDAYERLLLDVMLGDSTLFNRADEVEAAWEVVMPFLEAWSEQKEEFPNYEAGTWGPAHADDLLRADGRSWRRP